MAAPSETGWSERDPQRVGGFTRAPGNPRGKGRESLVASPERCYCRRPMLDTAARLSPDSRTLAVAGVPARRFRAAKFLGIALRLLAVFALISGTRSLLADQYEVPTGSMSPTIAPGDRIVVDKTAYGIRVPFTDLWV